MVLGLAFKVFSVSVDEQDAVALRSTVLVQDKDTGGDACTVKEISRQTNNCFQVAMIDKVLAGFTFLTTNGSSLASNVTFTTTGRNSLVGMNPAQPSAPGRSE